MAQMSSGLAWFYDFPSPLLVSALVIALVGLAGVLLSVGLLVPVWRHRSWSLGRRLRHTAAVAVMADLVLLLNHLNAIGFKYF